MAQEQQEPKPPPHDAAPDTRFQLYIDEGGTIHLAKGRTRAPLGRSIDAIKGENLARFLSEDSHFVLSDVLCSAVLGERMKETLLWVRNPDDGVVSGCTVTGAPQTFNDFYKLIFVPSPTLDYGPQSKNSPDGFTAAVSRTRAQAAASGAAVDMTFVDVADVQKIGREKGLEDKALEGFATQVENRLRQESRDETLGRIRPGRYGLVHDKATDLESVRGDIQGYAQALHPDAGAATIGTSTLSLEADDLDPEAVENAIGHAVERFEEAGLDAIIFDTLPDSQAAYLDHQHTRLQLLQEALAANGLDCVYRPVVSAQTSERVHLVAEVRALSEDDEIAAAEILRLSEEKPDLRRAVDHAACERLLSDPALAGQTVAIDLAIRSMLDQDLITMLLNFSHKMGQRRLILRLSGLKDTAVERVGALATLRRAGFLIALQAKELGPVTEARLKALPIDFILLDPSVVVDAFSLRHAIPSLNAMTQRCRPHDVGVIFEGVVGQDALRLLSRIEGALLAGPYFGDAA